MIYNALNMCNELSKVLFVLWRNEQGLDKLGLKVLVPFDRVCFPNCELNLK